MSTCIHYHKMYHFGVVVLTTEIKQHFEVHTLFPVNIDGAKVDISHY